MIWLKAKHLGHPAGRRFRIGGRTWILSTWRAHLPGTRVYWNYVRFWAAHPTNSVKHLRLNPFVRIARRYGKIHRSWWLWTIDAGNEIWNGGRGLHTAWFWAKP